MAKVELVDKMQLPSVVLRILEAVPSCLVEEVHHQGASSCLGEEDHHLAASSYLEVACACNLEEASFPLGAFPSVADKNLASYHLEASSCRVIYVSEDEDWESHSP